tara:strand:+ start:1540 stop:1743 length:204 start_codon:yes stop_codon:yes gene_type:complete
MKRELLSKECAFVILKHYYNINKGVYRLLRKHGIMLPTQATIKADRDSHYIVGTNREIVRTVYEVLG